MKKLFWKLFFCCAAMVMALNFAAAQSIDSVFFNNGTIKTGEVVKVGADSLWAKWSGAEHTEAVSLTELERAVFRDGIEQYFNYKQAEKPAQAGDGKEPATWAQHEEALYQEGMADGAGSMERRGIALVSTLVFLLTSGFTFGLLPLGLGAWYILKKPDLSRAPYVNLKKAMSEAYRSGAEKGIKRTKFLLVLQGFGFALAIALLLFIGFIILLMAALSGW